MPRRSTLDLTPALLAPVATVWLAWHGGGYTVDDWGPWAVLGLLALAAAVVAGQGAIGVAQAAGPLALAGLGAACLFSIAWAAWPQSALVEGGRCLAYAAVMGTALVAGSDERARRWMLASVGLASAIFAATLIADTALGADAGREYALGRLVGSIGYGGGIAAVLAIGVWPLLALAADRGLHAALRVAAGAAAGAAGALVVPTGARAAVLALVVSGVVFVLLSPSPARAGWLAAGGGLGIAGTWSSLNAAYPFSAGVAEVHTAGRAAIAVALVEAVFVGIALAAERWLLPAGRPRRMLVSGLVGMLVLVVLAAGVRGYQATGGDPAGWLAARWHQFTHEGNPYRGNTRFTSVGGGRYDLWRVAVATFHAHPLDGVGGGSFGYAYDRLGRSAAQPLQAHSEPLEVLATLGAPGGVLLALGLGLPLVAAASTRLRGAAPGEQWVAAGAGAGLAYFVAHSSVDWIWHIAADAVPAMVLAGVCLAGLPAGRRMPQSRRLGAAVVLAAIAAAAVVVAPATLAQRYLLRSYAEPLPAALHDADRAASFDLLSGRPALARARAELSAGNAAAALADARAAVAAEPRLWVGWELEQVAAGRVGDMAAARAAAEHVQELNPYLPVRLRSAVPPSAYDHY